MPCHSVAARLCALATLAVAAFFVAPRVRAEPSPALDRFSFSIGAFDADPTLNASVNTRFGRLDTGDIGHSNVTMPRIQADLLLGDSQGFSFDYFRYRRDYSRSFAGSAALGSAQLNAVGNVDLGLQLDFAKLAYQWWIGTGNTVLGLGAGAAYYRATLDTHALASVNGTTGIVSQRDRDDAVAPLLQAGVRHAITPDLRLFADASGVWKSNGNFHGSIYNAALGVEWFPVKNVGVVLSYNVTDIDLKRDFDNGEASARLRVKLRGPSAFLKARF